MKPSRQSDYDDIRRGFYTFFESRVLSDTGLVITAGPIDQFVLHQVQLWSGRRYQWDWSVLKHTYQHYPSRFELAIRSDTTLCGLAIGKPSKAREHMSAKFIEGHPNERHPLKGYVLDILLDGLEVYGNALQCKFARVDDVVEEIVPLYERAGYELANKRSPRLYLDKRLKGVGHGSSN